MQERVAYGLAGDFPAHSQFDAADQWLEFTGSPLPFVEIDDATIRRLGLRNAFQTPIAVEQPTLLKADLVETCQWLTERMVVFGKGWTLPPPLVFRLPDGSWLTDRTFWSVVCDVVDDAVELVADYVRGILKRYDNRLGEVHDRQESVPGEEALYAFADRRIHSLHQLGQFPNAADQERFLDVFTDFMALNDLGHEVRQYDEMMDVIEVLKRQLHARPELLERYVRLCAVFEHSELFEEGRHNSVKRRERLLAPGAFKLILTQLIGRDFAPEYLPLPVNPSYPDDYNGAINCCVAELIQLVYGDDPAQQDVYAWILDWTGLDIRPDTNKYGEYDRSRLETNLADLAAHPLRCQDNGFHQYDYQERRWAPFSAS